MKGIITGMLILPVFAAVASDYYLSANEDVEDLGAFTNKQSWVDASGNPMGAWDSDGEYYVKSAYLTAAAANRYLRTPSLDGEVAFPGGHLVIQGNSTADKIAALLLQTTGAGVTIESGVQLKANSRIISVGANKYALNADVTTAVGDYGTVPLIQAWSSKGSVLINGKLLSGMATKKDASIQIDPGASRGDFTVGFADNALADYPAQIDLNARPLPNGCVQSIRFVVGTDVFSGKIYPHRSDWDVEKDVPITFVVRKSEDVFKVATFGVNHSIPGTDDNGSFTLASGMAFEFSVDGATGQCGQFVVTKTLRTGYQNASNVVIRLVGNPVNESATNRFATLSVPKATPLDASNFVLESQTDLPWTKPILSVEENGDYSTVYVTVPPVGGDVVAMVKSDQTTHASTPNAHSAFESADSWSNEKVPEGGHIYLMAGTNDAAVLSARTPFTDWASREVPYEFPFGSSLCLWKQARIQTQKSALVFDDLRSYEGVLKENSRYETKAWTGIYKIQDAAETTTIDGNITIASGYFSIACFHGQTMVVRSKLHGTGTLAFSGMFVIDWDQGNYYLAADNDDFYGKITTRIAYRDGSAYKPSYDFIPGTTGKGYQTLWINSGRNLGADLAEPCADALLLTDYVRLSTTNTFTIAAKSNRGVTVDGNAVILTDAGKLIRIETPLTVKGNLYKDGAGVLTLAGATVAASGSDRLIVTNGMLQVAGENALRGLTVNFAAGTKIAVEPNVGTRGVDLTTSVLNLDASFAGKLPLVNDSRYKMRSEYEGDVAVFTVKTQDRAQFQAMLPNTPPKFFAHTMSVWNEPVDNGDGTTTFSVKTSHPGILLLVR